MKIIQIREHQSHDIVSTLEQLLAQARTGALTSVLIACKQDTWEQSAWAVGDWKDNPTAAMHAAVSMVRMLNRYATVIYPADAEARCTGCRFAPIEVTQAYRPAP